MSAINDKILVLGAGELGTPILHELMNPRWGHNHVTLLLRPTTIATADPQKKSELAAFRDLGIHFLPGDLVANSTSELAELFKNFHTVIGTAGYIAGPGTQLKLTHAVLQAGVPRYFPWQFGVDYDVIGRGSAQEVFDEQLDVRALLAAQTRTEWVVISTGVFTSFLFAPFFGVVDTATPAVHALGSLENRLTVTTVEDIGRLTVEILYAEPRLRNTVVYTAGDTLSYAQLADIVESVLGRKVQRDVWDLPKLQAQLEKDPENPVNKYAVVFAKGEGVAWNPEQTFNLQHNIPVVSAREWAIKNLK